MTSKYGFEHRPHIARQGNGFPGLDSCGLTDCPPQGSSTK